MIAEPSKVAVIIPAFHAEVWIRACLKSVATQSYDSWQAVVVEDGSKDATEKIVAEIAAAIPGRFAYINCPTNIGPAAARNLGIRQAESEFVAFIDADDLWACDHLGTLAEGAVTSGSDLAFSRFTEFTADAEATLDSTEPGSAPRDVTPMDLFESSPLLPSCVLVRRKAIADLGLFDESLRWSEDLDLWIRLMRSGARFHDSRRPTCWRRLSDTNLTSDSAKVAEYTGRLYLRHMDWAALDRCEVLRKSLQHLGSAAQMNFWTKPKLASELYYLSWRAQPRDVANFVFFLLARFAMLIPNYLRLRTRTHPRNLPANEATTCNAACPAQWRAAPIGTPPAYAVNPPTFDQLPKPPENRKGWPWYPEQDFPLPSLAAGEVWPKISIVTTLYNQVEFIEETVRSVLLQGYPNLEFIVINDSSTDGSLAIVEKYQEWIQIVNRPRGSQNNALNHGFRLATGDLIAWQNSDDLFGERSLAIGALAALENPEVSIIHGTTKCFWDFNIAGPYAAEVCEEFSCEAFLDRMCVMNQSMLFRRRIFDEGMTVREDMRFAGDQEFFWQLALSGYSFKLVPEMIGYYRWHRAAITFSPANNIPADREIFRMQRELFRNQDLSVEMRRKMRRKLWTSLFSAFRRCRRNIPYKIVPELFSFVRT